MFWFAVNSAHAEQATQIYMLVGSVANGLNSSGGFCAGSHIVVDHQRINGTSFVFTAAVPALLAISASEGINILRNTPSILSALHRAIRAVLDRVDAITIPGPLKDPGEVESMSSTNLPFWAVMSEANLEGIHLWTPTKSSHLRCDYPLLLGHFSTSEQWV